jgi:argininosuccinate lyase
LQEDKEATFDALETLSLVIAAMTGMVKDIEPDEKRMKAMAGDGYSTATDLADWLVQKLAIPFREAHEIVGKIVTRAAASGQALHRMPLDDMQGIDKRITDDVFSVLSVGRSVKSRTSFGGTAPGNVRSQARKWLKKLAKDQERA